MTDERESAPETTHNNSNDINNDMESLLPVPEESADDSPVPEQTDGTIDELLPSPNHTEDPAEDDTSTREEMEVDTSADGEDDFIPLNDTSSPSEVAPEYVDSDAGIDVDTSADGEDDFIPLNDTNSPSEAAPGYVDSDAGIDSGDTITNGATAPGLDVSDHDTQASTCLMCGAAIADSRFCPDCGTEQIPASRFVAGLAPLFMWSRTLPIRITLSLGAILALLALLADSGTTALIISASIVSIVLLIRTAEEFNGLSKTTLVQSGMMLLIGVAVGLPIAWLATRMVIRSWFDGGVINWGAVSFGGIAVDIAGNAPILVWLTNGILLPLVLLLVIGSAPGALRMALNMPQKEKTGMMLSSSVAAGIMIASAAVFYWPLYNELAPIMSTSEWTLSILGVAVIRPLVWVFAGGIGGAVVWRYLREASLAAIAIPAAIAIGLPLGYSLLSLAVAPAGLWASTIVGIVVAAVSIYFHTTFQKTAMRNDDQGS